MLDFTTKIYVNYFINNNPNINLYKTNHIIRVHSNNIKISFHKDTRQNKLI